MPDVVLLWRQAAIDSLRDDLAEIRAEDVPLRERRHQDQQRLIWGQGIGKEWEGKAGALGDRASAPPALPTPAARRSGRARLARGLRRDRRLRPARHAR